MEELIVLGTGNAAVTKCYNTCFALRKDEEFFLVDAGGGNGILSALEKAEIGMERIHHIFITHEHTDHLLGIAWLVRMIGTKMNQGGYEGELRIYCHEELVSTIRTIVELTVQKKFCKFDDRMIFVPLKDRDQHVILGHEVTFFDIGSTKAKQFGFCMKLQDGKTLTHLGDEPYREVEEEFVRGCTYLLHEAFCLYEERDIFKPYEKHHSTVKEACELATEMGVSNLVLWHTEDKDLTHRKERYTKEGRAYYTGKLYVPDDLDCITL